MKVDNFIPAPGKTITIAVGAASAVTPLPQTVAPIGGVSLELQNSGASAIFVEIGGPDVIPATVATSYPIMPNQSKIIDRKNGDTHIAAIGAVAGPVNLFVSAGVGS